MPRGTEYIWAGGDSDESVWKRNFAFSGRRPDLFLARNAVERVFSLEYVSARRAVLCPVRTDQRGCFLGYAAAASNADFGFDDHCVGIPDRLYRQSLAGMAGVGLFQAALSAAGADQPEIQRDLVSVVQCGDYAGRLDPLLVFRRRQTVLPAELKGQAKSKLLINNK